MRTLALASLILLALPALAQKPPALRAPQPTPAPNRQVASSPDEPPPDGAKQAYAGPQNTGKPAPLGSDERTPNVSAEGSPRPNARADQMPTDRERPESSGTGFVVATGRLLTNNHVVAECGRMVARNAQGVRTLARVLATDRTRDLALLSVPDDLGPPLTFRAGPAVRRGETVVTYGFPLSGLLSSGPSLTTGNISALAGLRDNPMNFQISAPVQPGNSGGPLLDGQGNVIGIVVSKLNAARIAEMTGGDIPQNVNFAVKGNEALVFLRANNVQPKTADTTGADKKNDEVGEIANPSTVYMQCYR